QAQLLREYKLVVIGGAGMSSVMSLLSMLFTPPDALKNPLSQPNTYLKRCVVDDEVALFDVLDPPGQEEYGALREEYMRTGEGFLLVYSITSRDSFEQISTFYQEILRIKGLDSFPAIVVANKCDLEHDRQVGTNEGRDLAKRFGCKFIETSTKQHINIDEAFIDLVREIRKYNKEQQTGRLVMANSANTPGVYGGSKELNSGDHGGCCSGCVLV
ncbi:hypothetical protein SCLCIDRAFT_126437, partial [Scleroderma citrinum Foug A]